MTTFTIYIGDDSVCILENLEDAVDLWMGLVRDVHQTDCSATTDDITKCDGQCREVRLDDLITPDEKDKTRFAVTEDETARKKLLKILLQGDVLTHTITW